MIPKAMFGPVLAMGRGPNRPPMEALLVRQAVADASPDAPLEPLARKLAKRVVEELEGILAEGEDPLLAALGDARRTVCPSPITALATDPDIDTAMLFVEQRVHRLRGRFGRSQSPAEDRSEIRAILTDVRQRLERRYLRHLRSNRASEAGD